MQDTSQYVRHSTNHWMDINLLRLANSLCDPDNASAGLARLTKCVTAAAHETLQVKQKLPLRKRKVSARTKHLYESRRRRFTTLSENERKEVSNAISKSGREVYREYVNRVLNDIEAAERVGNMREISRLTRQLTNKSTAICINPSKTRDGSQIVTESQLLKEWEQFLGSKFSRPSQIPTETSSVLLQRMTC